MRPFYAFELSTKQEFSGALSLFCHLQANSFVRADLLSLAQEVVGFDWESVYIFHKSICFPLRLAPPLSDDRLLLLLDEAICVSLTLYPPPPLESPIVLPQGSISVFPALYVLSCLFLPILILTIYLILALSSRRAFFLTPSSNFSLLVFISTYPPIFFLFSWSTPPHASDSWRTFRSTWMLAIFLLLFFTFPSIFR